MCLNLQSTECSAVALLCLPTQRVSSILWWSRPPLTVVARNQASQSWCKIHNWARWKAVAGQRVQFLFLSRPIDWELVTPSPREKLAFFPSLCSFECTLECYRSLALFTLTWRKAWLLIITLWTLILGSRWCHDSTWCEWNSHYHAWKRGFKD